MIDKYTLIKLKENNYSNREVASIMGIDRKTVASYWNDYRSKVNDLELKENDRPEFQKMIEDAKAGMIDVIMVLRHLQIKTYGKSQQWTVSLQMKSIKEMLYFRKSLQ